jgi:hypothetical protein
MAAGKSVSRRLAEQVANKLDDAWPDAVRESMD